MNDSRQSVSGLTPDAGTRWSALVEEGRIFCGPRGVGHHFSDTFDINESGFIRCGKWIAEEQRECGRWVFLYAIRGGKVVVAEVSLDERRAMRKLATPAQMIEYLGIFER